MTRIISFIAATALVALTGCAKSAPADNVAAENPAQNASTVNYLARIEALPQGQKEGVFLRAIRDSGQQCQGVSKAQSTETTGGSPAWMTTCTDGPAYVLVLGKDGMMNVTSAADVRGNGG
ncbi:MAG: hypothetical protein OSB00_10405 [Sphingomonas bacterium]|nr:hypothetical protein [Sphingomonas bacterium]